jgi:protein-tyrosine-phosphatase
MKLLFVCVENSNRSQMAEAFARIHGDEEVEAFSAGSRPGAQVNPGTVEAMKDKDYDLSRHSPKNLKEIPEGPYDAVVTMGCGEECPWIPTKQRFEWSMPDAKEGEELQRLRDMIEQEVIDLMREIRQDEQEGG